MRAILGNLRRLIRGILWRVVWLNRVVVYRSTAATVPPPWPEGCELIRINRNSCAEDRAAAEKAMLAAGESEGVARHRFNHDDELYGWKMDGRIVSFGWVTRRTREVGGMRLPQGVGRVFLYNFHTAADCRGRHYYPSLLKAIRYQLGREQGVEFIIDVNIANTASSSGVEKGGFDKHVCITFLTLFRRWPVKVGQCPVSPQRGVL